MRRKRGRERNSGCIVVCTSVPLQEHASIIAPQDDEEEGKRKEFGLYRIVTNSRH